METSKLVAAERLEEEARLTCVAKNSANRNDPWRWGLLLAKHAREDTHRFAAERRVERSRRSDSAVGTRSHDWFFGFILVLIAPQSSQQSPRNVRALQSSSGISYCFRTGRSETGW